VRESPVDALQALPSVDSVLNRPELQHSLAEYGRACVVDWVRDEVSRLRDELLRESRTIGRDELLQTVVARVTSRSAQAIRSRLRQVVNATGVVLHTSLGRAPLAQAAIDCLVECARGVNLEVDLATGERRTRGYQLDTLWRVLTGAEASLVVNNNAAATCLTLQALCAGREVILSRGQLIEIGGSFRLPEIFAASGAILREVGTTNRTRLDDYARALGPNTAAILRVHPSNYRVVGFADTPDIGELVALGRERGVPVIDDIGSGALVEMTQFGLPFEPTFQHSLAAGADLVLGSGDKLLGGPQCGILLGRRDLLDAIRQHPLARALRIDKLTLAALQSTLELYLRGEASQEIPTLRLLSTSESELRSRAEAVRNAVGSTGELEIELEDRTSPVGGGSLPAVELPTVVLALSHAAQSATELARRLRMGMPAVFGRIESDRVLLDFRSILAEQDTLVIDALRGIGG
jgi:L-seryl-tRNA(Ser) seleniumtransferase